METTAREKFINFDELQDVILHIDGGGAVAEVGASTTEAAVSSTGSSNENDVNHLKKELARLKKENAEKDQKILLLENDPPGSRHRRSAAEPPPQESTADLLKKLAQMGEHCDTKPPSLRPFDPSKMSIKTYVDTLKGFFKAYPTMTRDMCISNVTLALSDPYLSNWLLVIESDVTKAKDMQILLKEFQDAVCIEDASLSSNLFFNRQQKSNEDARSFGNNLFILARSAFGSLSPTELKTRVKEKFLRGLREPIGRNVRQLLPATYEDAVRFATAAESELDKSQEVMEINTAEEETDFYESDEEENEEFENERKEMRQCYRCGQRGHLARSCKY